jgi:DNA-binding transcriptional MerR regulator
MSKSPEAFRTISEVSEWLDTPTYVLRFWESRFPQIKPVKRAGGRRYYRPDDMLLLGGIKQLLHFDEQSIKDVKGLLKDEGVKHVMSLSPDLNTQVVSPPSKSDAKDKADIDRVVKATPSNQNKPAVEVRVVKKAKLAQNDAKQADIEAAKSTKAVTSQETAMSTEAQDMNADSETDLGPTGLNGAPYRIQDTLAYDADTMSEIETLYYDLRMARNSMRRAKKLQEQHAG